MEVKDLKVSLTPREAADIAERALEQSVSMVRLDEYCVRAADGEVVMRLFEKYYIRAGNRVTLTLLAHNVGGVTHVHLAAGGGGSGAIFRFDWGAGEDFAELAENALRQYMLE